MAVTVAGVRHVAALARLAVSDDQALVLVSELNSILRHMDALAQVDTDGLHEVTGVGAAGVPLRPDRGPPVPLTRLRDDFAPAVRDGFFLVPRLPTHEDADAAR